MWKPQEGISCSNLGFRALSSWGFLGRRWGVVLGGSPFLPLYPVIHFPLWGPAPETMAIGFCRDLSTWEDPEMSCPPTMAYILPCLTLGCGRHY